MFDNDKEKAEEILIRGLKAIADKDRETLENIIKNARKHLESLVPDGVKITLTGSDYHNIITALDMVQDQALTEECGVNDTRAKLNRAFKETKEAYRNRN